MIKTVDIAWTFTFSTEVEVEVDDELDEETADADAMKKADNLMRDMTLHQVINYLCIDDCSADNFETTDVY